MLLGLDVGGTFTDGAVVADGKVVSVVKTPTTHDNLLIGILSAVDQVVKDIGSQQFTRIALSTTVVTNALVEGTIDQVGLCIIPGPGMDIRAALPVEPYILSGYIDHRGCAAAEPRQREAAAACRHFQSCDVFAISGKFSVRNPCHELAVAQWVRQQANPDHITIGSEVSGSLNFLRRTNSAYYNAAVWRHFNRFAVGVETALKIRGISAPVYILKADGGTLPLGVARKYPVEGIFTGPAASVLGIMAISPTERRVLSLDIGGTTTDLALWENGVPLFAEGGARVGGFVTALRAFRLSSVGVGGDSLVYRNEGLLKIGPMRKGPAMAAGGQWPTVTDAMVAAELIDFGNRQLALEAMGQVAIGEQTIREAADAVLNEAVNLICQAIDDMLAQQASQPVYRVEDVVHGTQLIVEKIIGVGGSAAGLVPLVAKRMGLTYELPKQGMVANAIGAAVARPTVDVTLRADTAQGYYTVAELGIKNKLPIHNFTLSDAHQLAAEHLAELAERRGIFLGATEVIQSEEFNVIQGFSTIGKIITCRLQVKPGVLMNHEEGL
ncbi:MAG: hydantoinase/oxoprolinase family protein [Sporomusaceae bacterium]|nr:hydantoinase/oxoprolinase family protein [Sporomusaceae bacterium]